MGLLFDGYLMGTSLGRANLLGPSNKCVCIRMCAITYFILATCESIPIRFIRKQDKNEYC